MAKDLTFKKTTMVTLKTVGVVDIANGIIELEDGTHKILDLLNAFDGNCIELSAKIKNDEDLELPESNDEDDE